MQRQVLKQWAIYRTMNIAENYAAFNGSNGFTPPMVNDVVWGPQSSQMWLFNALKKPTINVAPSSGEFVATVQDVPTNHVGYSMRLPMPGPWIATGKKAALLSFSGLTSQEAIAPDDEVSLQIAGVGGDDRLAAKVEAHEKVHAGDILRAFDEILVPWDRALQGMKTRGEGYRGATPEAAVQALYAAAGGTPEEIVKALEKRFAKDDSHFHGSKLGKTTTHAPVYSAQDNRITIPVDLSIF